MAWSRLSLTQSHPFQGFVSFGRTQPFHVHRVYHCIDWDLYAMQYLVWDSIGTNGCE